MKKRPFFSPINVYESIYSWMDFWHELNGKDVMEVGSGLGTLAFSFSDRANSFVSVEIAADVVDFLNENYAFGYGNLDIVPADFLQYKDERRFDIFLSADTLEHISDVDGFVRKSCHFLKENGKAIIVFPNILSHGIKHYYKGRELIQLFQNSGYGNVGVFNVRPTSYVKWIYRFYFFTRKTLEKRAYTELRKQIYQSEKQHTCSETTAFKFMKESVGLKNDMARALSWIFCLPFCIKRPNSLLPISESDDIINTERILVVAEKRSPA